MLFTILCDDIRHAITCTHEAHVCDYLQHLHGKIYSERGKVSGLKFCDFGVPFIKVCGRALGYQYGHTDAFRDGNSSINSYYVEGLSVTHATPRNHIWTFAAHFNQFA